MKVSSPPAGIVNHLRRPEAAPSDYNLPMGVVWTRLIGLAYAALVIASLAAMAGEQSWVLELFSHFRVQYVAGTLVLMAIMASVGRWLLAGLLLPVLVLNTMPLLPYVGSAAAAASASNPVTLATVNLQARNRDAQRLLALIRAEQPDIIVLQELTPRWEELIQPLAERYPHRLLVPRDGVFGIALLSIYPLTRQQVVDLNAPAYPAITATVQVGARQLNVIGVHPLSPTSATRARQRNAQLAALGKLAANSDRPLVMLGDFNSTPWSPHFQRLLADTGLRDAAAGLGLDITWPAFMPLLGVPIDHCLVSPEVAVNGQRRGRSIGSDHYPLFTEVSLL